MRSLLAFAVLGALAAACTAGAAPTDVERVEFRPRAVASGFSQPVFVTAAKGEAGRLYVVEQTGRIVVLRNGRRAGTFLDIRGLVLAPGSEQGLLGFAFHPSYPRVKKAYVQYTARNGSTQLVEYRVAGGGREPPRPLFLRAGS
jgi:Glucose / Sorbosone dehydrogenase